ncbi:MAG: hypothetical protein ACOYZ7_03005 [Chloroflexota bacterium]
MTGEEAVYEIRLQGHLEDFWRRRFEGMTLTRKADGTSVLVGPVADQSALFGLLEGVRDLGLPLVSVCRVESEKGGRT